MMLLGAYVVQTGGTLAWEPFVASIPVALLAALILYVNEIPDRRGDAIAGKRTLPVRYSRNTVIAGYDVAVTAAYVVLVLAVVAGILPVPVLLMLLTIPLALRVSRGLMPYYDNPYGLMSIMGVNVQLHLRAGLLLAAAYAIVLVVGRRRAGCQPLHLRPRGGRRVPAARAPHAVPRAAQALAGTTNGPSGSRSRSASRSRAWPSGERLAT